MDEILWRYNSNETSREDILHGAFYFLEFSKKKFKLFVNFFTLATHWSESVNTGLTVTVRQKCRLQGT